MAKVVSENATSVANRRKARRQLLQQHYANLGLISNEQVKPATQTEEPVLPVALAEETPNPTPAAPVVIEHTRRRRMTSAERTRLEREEKRKKEEEARRLQLEREEKRRQAEETARLKQEQEEQKKRKAEEAQRKKEELEKKKAAALKPDGKFNNKQEVFKNLNMDAKREDKIRAFEETIKNDLDLSQPIETVNIVRNGKSSQVVVNKPFASNKPNPERAKTFALVGVSFTLGMVFGAAVILSLFIR